MNHSEQSYFFFLNACLISLQVKADYRKALKKMLSSTEYTKALSEITKFSNKEGVFGDPDIMSLTDENHPDHIPTYQFWAEYGELALCIWSLSLLHVLNPCPLGNCNLNSYAHDFLAGDEVPTLSKVAQKVTAMTSGAGACERNLSAYDFIHCKKRNKLTPERANDLVFVFSNLRLMKKFKDPEKFADWVSEIEPEQEEALLQEEGDEIELEEGEAAEELADDSDVESAVDSD